MRKSRFSEEQVSSVRGLRRSVTSGTGRPGLLELRDVLSRPVRVSPRPIPAHPQNSGATACPLPLPRPPPAGNLPREGLRRSAASLALPARAAACGVAVLGLQPRRKGDPPARHGAGLHLMSRSCTLWPRAARAVVPGASPITEGRVPPCSGWSSHAHPAPQLDQPCARRWAPCVGDGRSAPRGAPNRAGPGARRRRRRQRQQRLRRALLFSQPSVGRRRGKLSNSATHCSSPSSARGLRGEVPPSIRRWSPQDRRKAG